MRLPSRLPRYGSARTAGAPGSGPVPRDARGEAVTALQLRPTEPQALRAVARFLSRTHQPEALEFWKQLAGKTSLTRQDVRDEAMIEIIAGDRARADAAVRELIGSRAEPVDWLLAAQLSIQKNLLDEAKSYLEKTVADSRPKLRVAHQ